MTWLVIGYGCDISSDDGFGPSVAHELQNLLEQGKIDENIAIDVQAKRILAPEIVENIRRAEGVIFIDASVLLSPGSVQCTELQCTDNSSSIPDYTSVLISHHCTPTTLLELSRDLYKSTPPAWLYQVGASDFNYSETMRAELAALVPVVTQQVIDKITNNASAAERKKS